MREKLTLSGEESSNYESSRGDTTTRTTINKTIMNITRCLLNLMGVNRLPLQL